jgi:hypothetical protein
MFKLTPQRGGGTLTQQQSEAQLAVPFQFYRRQMSTSIRLDRVTLTLETPQAQLHSPGLFLGLSRRLLLQGVVLRLPGRLEL